MYLVTILLKISYNITFGSNFFICTAMYLYAVAYTPLFSYVGYSGGMCCLEHANNDSGMLSYIKIVTLVTLN